MNYRDAGVDIDAGNALVRNIKAVAESTRRPEVLSGLGGFGGLCEIPDGYKEPVLVSATDGVGTKLKLAMELGKHDTIGIDLVAMCVNDLIVCGAEPLFFLDYYATGKLNVATATEVVKGIGDGCEMANCALIGGETAEMPGMYQNSDYDLAGFAVGVVEKKSIITPKGVKAGDCLLGLPSSGPHSNGYSLIRKILEVSGAALDAPFDESVDSTLGAALLEPTEIYVKPILSLVKAVEVHGIAHITGGGIAENLVRVLPVHCSLDTNAWEWPPIFRWLKEQGNVKDEEMIRVFNCGLGMIVAVAAANVDEALESLAQEGVQAMVIGEIKSIDGKPQVELE